MTYPGITDWPASLDAIVTRVDNVDIVFDEDFNYPDSQIRAIQVFLGATGDLIGAGAAGQGAGGLLSPIADGVAAIAFKLVARDSFLTAGGKLLSLGDDYDAAPPAYTQKFGVDQQGILEINAVTPLPAAGVKGRLAYFTDDDSFYRDNGVAWSQLGGGGKLSFGIVVGNSVVGDTIADCDFLDTGNGVQLAAAIAAASADADVYVRPGVYDFRAAGPATRLTIPAGVRVRGAGEGHTLIITNNQGDARAFLLGDDSVLEDMYIQAPQPVAAQAGAGGIVSLGGSSGRCERVTVETIGAWAGANPAHIVVTAAFDVVAGASGVTKLVDCWGVNLPILVYAGTFKGILAEASTVEVARPVMAGGRYSIAASIKTLVMGGKLTGAVNAAVSLSADYCELIGSHIEVTDLAGAVTLTGASRCAIQANSIIDLGGTAGNIAIKVETGSSYNVIQGNRGNGNSAPPTGWETAVQLDSGSSYNTVLGNAFGGGAAYSDSGTANDMAHSN